MNRFEFYDRLKDYNSLSHADKYGPASGTNKYYAKLDDFYGKGKPRYFYSKEEWDGYNKNKSYSQNAEKNKAKKQKNANDPNYKKNEEAAKAGNGERDRYKKQEWNEASKKSTLYNSYEDKRKAIDKYLADNIDKDWTPEMHNKFDSKFENSFRKGEGFYVVEDPRELDYGKAKMDDSYAFKLGEPYNTEDGPDSSWQAPGLKDPKDYTWTKEDEKKAIEYNQAIIDHCLDFYETYVLNNDETWPNGQKKYTKWQVKREIEDYLNRVIPKAFKEYRDEDVTSRIVPNNAGYALKHVLWNAIEKRIDSEQKAWDRTHK